MCLVLHHGEQCWVVTLQQEAAWLRYVPTPFLTHAYYNKNTGTYMPPTMKWFHWWEQWQSWCSKCREVFVWHHACQIQLFVLTRGSAAYLAPSLSEVNSLTHSSIIFLAHYWKRHTHINLSTLILHFQPADVVTGEKRFVLRLWRQCQRGRIKI